MYAMNTNNNVYTVVYTTLVCVLVAAILAFVSMSLKGRQEANEKAETIRQILSAAQFDVNSLKGNDAIINFYKENLSTAFLINAEGNAIEGKELNCDEAEIVTIPQLKRQNYNVTDEAKAAQIEIPVYAFNNGVVALPIYGAGLWGPVWGYIALEPDYKTIKGAYFDHASETPGLGGKIKDDPAFRAQFCGKEINFDDVKPFAIVKGGAPAGKANAIDAISGATMTSNGVDAAISAWVKAYQEYILKQQAVSREPQGDVMPLGGTEEENETVNE